MKGSSEHSPAFQRMMAHITQNTAPIEEVSAEVDHDNTSHVLISNTGQDFFDGKSSIRNAAFQRMMREMGQGEDGFRAYRRRKKTRKSKKVQLLRLQVCGETPCRKIWIIFSLRLILMMTSTVFYDSFHDPEREAYLASVDNDHQNGFRSGSHGGSSDQQAVGFLHHSIFQNLNCGQFKCDY